MLVLSTCKGIEVININTIIRVEAISNYSKLFFSNGKTLVVAKVLAWFEDKLPGWLFVRVHRSHIINLRYMRSWCNNRISRAILRDNTVIEISRRRKKKVMEILKDLSHEILLTQLAA